MYQPQLQPESAGGQSCCIPTPASPIPTPDIVEQILDFKLAGNFCGRIKGVKYRFARKDGTWDFPGDARNFGFQEFHGSRIAEAWLGEF